VEELRCTQSYATELETKLKELSSQYLSASLDIKSKNGIRTSADEVDRYEQLKKKNYDEVKSKLILEEKRRKEIEQILFETANPKSPKTSVTFRSVDDHVPGMSPSKKPEPTLSSELCVISQDTQKVSTGVVTREINWDKRTKIAEEIVETERSYVNSLSLMLEVFYKKFNIQANEPECCISQSDVKTIFSCAEIILSYNRELLKDLEIVINTWDPKSSKLGCIFATISDFLKTYMTYVSNYTVALRTLDKCKNDTQFSHMLQEAERDPRLKSMPLTGFLIMPVQRIPRYLMLLKELLKFTPPGHVDYEDLTKAHEKIATVALDVNESGRNAENLNTIYQIQTLLGGQVETIVEPHRRLVKHGRVLLLENHKKKNRISFFSMIWSFWQNKKATELQKHFQK